MNEEIKSDANTSYLSNGVEIESNTQEKTEKLQKMLEDIIFYGITMPLQLIQTIGVFVIAYFNEAFPELFFFLLGFFFSKTILGDAFHMGSTVTCTSCTWLTFFLVTALIPSVYASVFLCLILGFLLAAYLNYIVVNDKKYKEE